MPRVALLECAVCHGRIPADPLRTCCPEDGGPLLVRYEPDLMHGASVRREAPAAAAAGTVASPGVWRYRDVLPEVRPVSLGEGWTPVLPLERHAGLLLKEEGANPAGSWRAREMGVAVSVMRDKAVKDLFLAGEGEAACALAAYAAAGRIAASLVVRPDVARALYSYCVLYGARVSITEGPAGARGVPPAESGFADGGWADLSAPMHPLRIEGAKTLGYELVEQLGWSYPAAIILPGECDSVVLAMGKAFDEMEALGWVRGTRPRLYAAQSAAPGPDGPSPAATVATEILQRSGGRRLVQDEASGVRAAAECAAGEGILLSLAGGLGLAAYQSLVQAGEVSAADRVVLVNPAAGWTQVEETARRLHVRRPGPLPTSLPVGGIITPV